MNLRGSFRYRAWSPLSKKKTLLPHSNLLCRCVCNKWCNIMPTIISYDIILRIIPSQVFSLLYKTKSTLRSSFFMRTIFAKYIGPFSLNLLQVSSSGSIKKHVDQDLSSQSYNSKIYFVIHLLVCGYRRVDF